MVLAVDVKSGAEVRESSAKRVVVDRIREVIGRLDVRSSRVRELRASRVAIVVVGCTTKQGSWGGR